MDSSDYYILNIQGVSSAKEDLMTSELFDAGAAGVQENLEFTQLDRSYLPEVVEAEIKNLIVYFEQAPSPQWLEDFRAQNPELTIRREKHESVDWLSQWKEQWKPFELIKGVWIVPDWHRDSFDLKGGKGIFIEPGMAFGTGTHATTQIASQLIDHLVQSQPVKSMLDVGTGSGILSLLADLKGISQVHAYDNDLESKRVFFENLEKNSKTHIVWEENWAQNLSGQIELTLANIIDGVLLDLKPLFQKMKSPFYIFTGILREREEPFLQEMLELWDLQQLKRVEQDEWVGFLFRNPL